MASGQTRLRVNQRSPNFRKCVTQKAGFSTYDEALDAAERMMAAGRVHPGCHVTPYVCKECGEHHLANRVIVFVPKEEGRAW